MALRHVPERTCVGCRTQQPKRALVRIVRGASGEVAVDSTGKRAGRGAYLCGQVSCWATGLGKGGLARALKVTLSAPDRAALESYAAALPSAASSHASEVSREGVHQ